MAFFNGIYFIAWWLLVFCNNHLGSLWSWSCVKAPVNHKVKIQPQLNYHILPNSPVQICTFGYFGVYLFLMRVFSTSSPVDKWTLWGKLLVTALTAFSPPVSHLSEESGSSVQSKECNFKRLSQPHLHTVQKSSCCFDILFTLAMTTDV